MKCPKCKKGEIKENISYNANAERSSKIKEKILGVSDYGVKIFTYFCPLCDFHKEKRIKISYYDFNAELRAKARGKKEAESKIEFGGFSVEAKGKEK